MALTNGIPFEKPEQIDQTKPQQTSLLTMPQEVQAGPPKQWVLPPLPQECLLYPEDGDCQTTNSQAGPSKPWVLPPLPQECLLYPEDGDCQTTNCPHTSAMEEVPSPFRVNVARDQLKQGGENTMIGQPEFSTSKPASLQTSLGPRLPLTSITNSQGLSTPLPFTGPRGNNAINHPPACPGPSFQSYTWIPQPQVPFINAPSAAVLKGKSTSYPVFDVPIFDTAPRPVNSNEASTERRTRGEQIPREMEMQPPKAQQLVASQPAPRRRHGTGGGQPRPRRRASKGRPEASSKPMPGPIPGPPPNPVPYRRIQDAQGQPIFRKAEHDKEGLAGMIGVTREEWYLGLRTPVYAPQSDGMRLRVLRGESEMAREYPLMKETRGYLERREEEVELERRVHAEIMKVGRPAFKERLRIEELIMGVPILEVTVLKKNGGGAGSRSKEKATSESTEADSPYSGATSQASSYRSPYSGATSQASSYRTNPQPVEGMASESSYGTARSTLPDLGDKYAMRMNGREGMAGIVGPAEPTSTTKESAAVGRSDGTREAPICVYSSSAGEDGYGDGKVSEESFVV